MYRTTAALIPATKHLASFVSRIRTATNWFAFRSSYVGSFISLLTDNDIELNDFPIADGTNCLSWIIHDDGGLMYKYILFRVITIDETVAALYIEPFHGSAHLNC